MKNVLIADDEKSFLLSLQDGLKLHGDQFRVLTAENGREAMEILQETSVDLLITDLKMPEMDGFELLAWVSQQLPELPVIVMTAFGRPDIEARLEQHNTLQYLEKPLDLATMEKAILDGLESETKSYIQGITLATFLQLMQLEKKSCTLKVTSSGDTGYLYLQQGQLIDAKFGDLGGKDAAYRIISWEETEIEMDNICPRQEDTINGPLEMVLLNTFRRKDELENIDEVETQNESRQPDKTQELLAQQLNSHTAIQEFGLFNHNSGLEISNSGQFSLNDFDPTIYLHLTALLNEELNADAWNWISFFTTTRNHYLLFNLAEDCLLVELRQGARPQIVGQEVSRMLNKLQLPARE